MDRSSISSLSGTLSFIIWLFAQTPQIIKNHHRESVDGLSLVFLFQWIAGDVLNLVGCLLTGQLAFQVAVACWFVAVDVVLSWQVFLYTHLRPRRKTTTTTTTSSSRHRRKRYHESHASSSATVKPIDQWYYERARRSTSRKQSRRSQSYSVRGRPKTQDKVKADMSASVNLEEQRGRHVRPSLNVLSADGLGSGPPAPILRAGESSSSSSSSSSSASSQGGEDDGPRGRSAKRPVGVRITNTALPALSRSSSTSSYRQMTEEAIRVLRIVERLEGRRGGSQRSRSGMTSPEDGEGGDDTPDYFSRGRAKWRSAGAGAGAGADGATRRAMPTSLASSTASSRSASRVPKRSSGDRRHNRVEAVLMEEGRVNEESDITIRDVQPARSSNVRTGLLVLGGVLSLITLCGILAYLGSRWAATTYGALLPWSSTVTTPPPPDTTQILGRLSSWLCTILYVTSRLPQIWENQTRRSCEGISILLFVAAFLGNFFYAVSILCNPASGQWLGRGGNEDEVPFPDDPWWISGAANDEEARRYLMESMPFLLGSAGTLLFDAVVLGQWWWFGERHEVGHSQWQSRSHSHHAHTETTPLLLGSEHGR